MNRICRSFLPLVAAAVLAAPVSAFAAPNEAKETKPTPVAAAGSVDLNTASRKDLEALPGIGAATSKKIVAGRPYARVEDLSRAGLSAKTIDGLRPLVTVGHPAGPSQPIFPPAPKKKARQTPPPAPVRIPTKSAPLDLNTASQRELEGLPGVGSAFAKRIVDARPYSSVADLSRAKLPKSTLDRIAPLVTVSGAAGASTPMGAADKPMSPAPPARSNSARTRAATPAPAGAEARTPGEAPPSPGLVWVNTDTKVYHLEGDWYGKTQHGKWMTESGAIEAGYRRAKKG